MLVAGVPMSISCNWCKFLGAIYAWRAWRGQPYPCNASCTCPNIANCPEAWWSALATCMKATSVVSKDFQKLLWCNVSGNEVCRQLGCNSILWTPINADLFRITEASIWCRKCSLAYTLHVMTSLFLPLPHIPFPYLVRRLGATGSSHPWCKSQLACNACFGSPLCSASRGILGV